MYGTIANVPVQTPELEAGEAAALPEAPAAALVLTACPLDPPASAPELEA